MRHCGLLPMLRRRAYGRIGRAPADLPARVQTLSTSSRQRNFPVTRIKDAAAEFLAHQRVAVTGVSRTPGSHGSNVVYRRLRERGYQVFAVNPNATEVEGDRAY